MGHQPAHWPNCALVQVLKGFQRGPRMQHPSPDSHKCCSYRSSRKTGPGCMLVLLQKPWLWEPRRVTRALGGLAAAPSLLTHPDCAPAPISARGSWPRWKTLFAFPSGTPHSLAAQCCSSTHQQRSPLWPSSGPDPPQGQVGPPEPWASPVNRRGMCREHAGPPVSSACLHTSVRPGLSSGLRPLGPRAVSRVRLPSPCSLLLLSQTPHELRYI